MLTRRLLEICLTVCEWIQEKNIRRAAKNAARQCERKGVLTFLSQGAVAGAFGYFAIIVVVVVSYPSDFYFYFYSLALPFLLLYGSLLGGITALFIWLPGRLLARRFGFIARTAFGIVAIVSFSGVWAYLSGEFKTDAGVVWGLAFICGWGSLVAFMTGSATKPCRMAVFGTGSPTARSRFGSWLSTIPFGFPLRVLSILGLLEALLALAISISTGKATLDAFLLSENRPVILFAILYFALSTYFSFRSQHKVSLLATAIVLNLPLAAWIGSLRRAAGVGPSVLGYLLLGFMGLWFLYTFVRLIVPEKVQQISNSVRETDRIRWTQGKYSLQL